MPRLELGLSSFYTESGAQRGGRGVDLTSFISTWDTTGSSEKVTLPFVSSGSIDFTIDWGDGGSDTVTAYDDDLGGGGIDHTYSSAATYTITMAGTIRGFKFNNSGDKTKIKSITQWGTFDISTSSAFRGCSALNVTATDAPTISSTDLELTFQDASSLTGGVADWDVSSVTVMYRMFLNCTNFNQDIGDWDTSSVTTFGAMFSSCSNFNQDLSDWDVSTAAHFYDMFYNATAFNNGGVALTWTTSSTNRTMNGMFQSCTAFNQAINSWNTSGVTSMSGMFRSAVNFNQDISDWNTAAVTNMSLMFKTATVFNQDINRDSSKWNTVSVTTTEEMFNEATAFNGNITSWDVSNVRDMTKMFRKATNFNQDINSWDTSSVLYLQATFSETNFNQPLNDWDTSSVTRMWDVFYNSPNFNQPLSGWDTSSATNLGGMFRSATAFNQDISAWTVAQITSFDSFLLYNTGMSTANWNLFLIRLEATSSQSSVALHGGDANATGDGAAARLALENDHGWTIVDGDG